MITGRIAFSGKTLGDVRIALEQALASLENGLDNVMDGDDDHAYRLQSQGEGNTVSDLDAVHELPRLPDVG